MGIARARWTPGRAVALFAASASLLAPAVARAQAPEKAALAEQLFQDGQALFATGKTHEACEKFAASNEIDPAPGTLNNLALCHEKEGRTASAWVEWNLVLAAARHAGRKDKEHDARAHAAALEKALSRVEVKVPEGVHATALLLDGAPVPLAALTTALPVDPGEHAFDVTDDGGRHARTKTVVPAGPSTTVIVLTFEAAPPAPALPAPAPAPAAPVPPPAAAAAPASSWTGMRSAGVALFGVGGVGIAVGSAFGLVANAHRNDHPNDDAFHDATISTALFAVGLAAAAAGVVLFVASPRSNTPSTSASRAVWVGPGSVGFGGTF